MSQGAVLVTRPREDAISLVAALEQRGCPARLCPLLEIVPLPEKKAPLNLAGVQALAVTSANGLRAFTRRSDRRDLPVFTVGHATARSAQEAGFTRVYSAGGDVSDLARIIVSRLKPDQGILLHPASTKVAGDLKGALKRAGFQLRRATLYQAHPAKRLPPDVRAAFLAGEIKFVALYSPRTGGTFTKLVRQAGISEALGSCVALCLSDAVADTIKDLPWGEVRVAAHPDQAALLACLDVREVEGMASDSAKKPAASGKDGKDNPESTAALAVIELFGGIRPMANKLNVAVSTIQGWKERSHIPENRHEEVRAAARKHGIKLEDRLLASSGVVAGDAADGKAADSKPADAKAPDAKAAGVKPAAALSSAAKSDSAKPDTAKSDSAVSGDAKSAAAAAPKTSSVPAAGPPPQAQESGGWVVPFFVGALVFAAGGLVAVFTQDIWGPMVGAEAEQTVDLSGLESRLDALETAPAGASAAALEDLSGRIGDLDSRMAEIAAAGGSGAAPDPALAEDLSALRGTADDLAVRLAALEAAAAGGDATAALSGLQSETSALGSRMAALETALTGLAALPGEISNLADAQANLRMAASGDTALVLGVLQLRDALRGTAPYEQELNALKSLAENDPALKTIIAPLDSHAASGLPSLKDLQTSFPAMARNVIALERGEEAEGIGAGILRRLSSLVTIRRTGMVEGEDASAVVARAEVRLNEGDLEGAVQELAGLTGPAAEAAAGWRGDAQAKVTAAEILSQLGAQASARLTAIGG